jgi:hypothetical protein
MYLYFPDTPRIRQSGYIIYYGLKLKQRRAIVTFYRKRWLIYDVM